MKFKVGDTVRLKDGLEVSRNYGAIYYSAAMRKVLCGKELSVAVCDSRDNTYHVDLTKPNESLSHYWVAEEMLEPADVPDTNVSTVCGDDIIKDNGGRTEYDTGAVRDVKAGKGRCDLMPLDVVGDMVGELAIKNIALFQQTGSVSYLFESIKDFAHEHYAGSIYKAVLEVSKRFEAGAIKYGEGNWKKGIPVHSYIDSAVRHYLRFRDGETDEHHDRAFVWNILCCIWTMRTHPELDDFTEVRNEKA